jgi:ADP-heptose:LPS heptosyltransferase
MLLHPKPTLLVLRHNGLGDLLTVQPALRGLRRFFPDHELVVTCPSWLSPLAEYFGSADRIVTERHSTDLSNNATVDPSAHQQAESALLDNILGSVSAADILICLRTPGPELLPIVRRFDPRLFVSYRYALLEQTGMYPELDFSDHILVRWQRLLGTMGITLRDEDLYAQLEPPANYRDFTVVHIGAGSPARLWPVERWIAVIARLNARGHRVILTGSEGEAGRVEQVRENSGLPPECNRSGKTDIMELAALVAGARLVLCTDTGISHLATTFRRPAITLFGPVPPAWWGPPPGHLLNKAIWTGRTGDNYCDCPDPGLLEISVDSVLERIEEFERESIQAA